jgi:hypothetical protein
VHRSGQDHAVDPALDQRPHLLELALRVALAAMDQHRVASAVERALD